MVKENKQVVTMRELLECGVHFGHQTKRWNSKMKKYIFTSRNGIHVIDLQQTLKLIKQTYQIVKEAVQKGGTVLFVGTKKQAQDAIFKEAVNCEMPYVHHRWLGGTLTNYVTLQQSIKKLKEYQRMNEEGAFEKLSKKESSRKLKQLAKLEYYLNGIKDLNRLPSLVFIVDTKREQLAVKEANRLKIPIIGVLDTNADPTEVQHPIPANDDAIRAVRLICSIISKAVLDSKGASEKNQESGEQVEVNRKEKVLEKASEIKKEHTFNKKETEGKAAEAIPKEDKENKEIKEKRKSISETAAESDPKKKKDESDVKASSKREKSEKIEPETKPETTVAEKVDTEKKPDNNKKAESVLETSDISEK